MPDIRDRFIRHTTGPIEPGPRPTSIPKPDAAREIDIRLPWQPDLASVDGLPENLINAHSGARHAAAEIRRKADLVWRDEPAVPGVQLTAAQRHALKRQRVAEATTSETQARLKVLRPIVERHKAELATRREALIKKGTPRLIGIEAERALRLADAFARLEPEVRAARIIDALNDASNPDSRELLAAVAWSNPHMDLVSPETRERCLATLVATSNAGEYDDLTRLDGAIAATEESISNLEAWAEALPNEF